MRRAVSKYETVDGIRTHYLEAGQGPTVVLFHGGEFGGCGEISWEFNIDALAEKYHVIAPDWLGFGRTDKIYDFVNGNRRVLDHMGRFLQQMGADKAHFIGNSMGGAYLLRGAVGDTKFTPLSMVLASAGGFAPDNEFRRRLLNYDCTLESMRHMMSGVFWDPKWAADDEYMRKRHRLTLEPGVWECAAAPRFKAPHVPPRSEFGQPDNVAYESITCPVLVITGDHDRLREPNYADELARRIPRSELIVFEDTGHCPNIERAAEFNEAVLRFLGNVSA